MNLLNKELRLTLHPTALIFPLLSAMVLIPNYPYYVIFFYTTLAVFFTCLSGRENQDILYTMLLPVSRRDLVRARFATVMLMELVQLLLTVPFALLRAWLGIQPNAAGMEANLALVGLVLPMLGLFHLTFFGLYYRDVRQVGRAFILPSALIFVYLFLAEACTYAVPFVRDCLDTPDPQFLPQKLAVLAVGALLYAGCTALAFRRAVHDFEQLDL